MLEIGARGFANARIVEPRAMPVPFGTVSRATGVNFTALWFLHKRVIVKAAYAALVLAALGGLVVGRDAIANGLNFFGTATQEALARTGFGVDRIDISGLALTDQKAVAAALALAPTATVLSLDVDAALDRVLALPSVKAATIRKIYPDRLAVVLAERVPMARWRIGDATWLVDETGAPVARDDGGSRDLPLVVGEGAADDAMVMIRTLGRYPVLNHDLAALSRLGDRRWDLVYYSGLRVKLPESGVARALAHLDMYQRTYRLLDRDLVAVDLRVPGMVSLELGNDAMARRAADIEQAKKTPLGVSPPTEAHPQ